MRAASGHSRKPRFAKPLIRLRGMLIGGRIARLSLPHAARTSQLRKSSRTPSHASNRSGIVTYENSREVPGFPPSQTWHTFLKNHLTTMVSVDFFTVPTLRFQVLSSWYWRTTDGRFSTFRSLLTQPPPGPPNNSAKPFPGGGTALS